MAATIGALTATLRLNVRFRPATLGFRMRLAAGICSIAAWLLGGRVIVDFEPTLETNWGNEGRKETLLGTIPIIGSESAAN